MALPLRFWHAVRQTGGGAVKFTFTHMKGSKAGTTQELEADVVTVGRDPQNQLAYDPAQDDKVSSFHATIAAQGGQVVVTDVGSRNGTFVNGHRITGPTPIVPGAVLQFGEAGPLCAVLFAAGAGAAAAAPAGKPAAPAPAAKPAPAPAAAKPATPAPAPGAAAAAAAPAAAPAAPAPAKPAGKSRGCMVVSVIGGLLLACVLGTVAVALREQISKRIPSGLMTYVQKIPGLNKLFKVPPPPRLPAGIKLPQGGGAKPPPPATEAPPPADAPDAPPPATTEGQ